MPDDERHPQDDAATVGPPVADSRREPLPLWTRRPRVYRPRSWLVFAVAALAAALVTLAVVVFVVSLR